METQILDKKARAEIKRQFRAVIQSLPTLRKRRKKVGLALGSGGVRGLAHIGILKVLLDNNIPIDYIAGCSIGAWVGAHYALYKDFDRLAELTVGMKKEKLKSFMEPTLKGGFVKGEKFEALFNEWLDGKTFADTQIPIRMVAADLVSGEQVILHEGSLAHAARVSMASTGVFSPIIENGLVLADGGLINPVPDDVVREMGADVVIAINLDDFNGQDRFVVKEFKELGLMNVATRTIEVMRHHLARYSLRSADVVITPRVARFVNWKEYFWNNAGDAIVEEGRIAALKAIDIIKKVIK